MSAVHEQALSSLRESCSWWIPEDKEDDLLFKNWARVGSEVPRVAVAPETSLEGGELILIDHRIRAEAPTPTHLKTPLHCPP